MPRKLGYAALALLAAAAVAPAATAKEKQLSLTVKPQSPYTDDDIKVSFTPKHSLRSGRHYRFVFLHHGAKSGNCTAVLIKNSRRKGKRGKRFTFSMGPEDRVLGTNAWCRGRTHVLLFDVSDSDEDDGKQIGQSKEFRVRAAP